LPDFGSVACPKQERRETAKMIEMKVANPDCVEIGPVKLFLGQTVRSVGADVEQDCAAVSFQPIA